MTFLTKNTPDKKTVDIFSKLCEDDLKQLVRDLQKGNFGKITVASETALKEIKK